MATKTRKTTRRTTVTVRYSKRKSRDTPPARKPPNKKKQKSIAKSRSKVTEIGIEENGKEFNIADYLTSIQETEKSDIRTDSKSIAISSCDVTEQHFKRKNKMENSFIAGIGSVHTKDG